MAEHERAFGDAYPKSLQSAIRRAKDIDYISDASGEKIVLLFDNLNNAGAAYEWLVQNRKGIRK